MSLGVGSRIGPYEVTSLLGAGGMGEVYRARDTRLKREVALKVLPEAFATDPERLARFQREAELLASINHPHIASIYGMEEVYGGRVLVLELADGGTLDQRLAKGAIPVDEAVAVARQIADALEAAHDKGIIHRDLKPSNIGFTADGQVKVLDFGLAKLAEQSTVGSGQLAGHAVSLSPTITSPALITGAGALLGTAAYMSPEQAKGRDADKRSDVWAFGCVLYELLTGTRPFNGEDVADVLAATLRTEPDWHALQLAAPPALVTLTKACLAKDRRVRLDDLAGALLILTHAESFAASDREPAAMRAGADKTRWWRMTVVVGGASLVAGVLLTVFASGGLQRTPTPHVSRLDVTLPRDAPITGQGVAISPDGRVLAIPARNRLLLRRLDRAELTELPGTEGATLPFFSPDGTWVGFVADGVLRKVRSDGTTPLIIARAGIPIGPPAWGADDTILFSTVGTGLYRISASGGSPAVVTVPRRDAGEVSHSSPQWLPDGRVLFTVEGGEQPGAAILSLDSGEWQPVAQSVGRWVRYVATGHLIFVRENTLFAVPYRPGDRAVSATPVAVQSVTDGIAALSENGTLAVLSEGSSVSLTSVSGRLVVSDRAGTLSPPGGPEFVTVQGAASGGLSLSPDGVRLAAGLGRESGGADLWIYDLRRRTRVRITDQGDSVATTPVWSPDGREVLFNWTRDPPGLYAHGADLGAAARLVLKRDAGPQLPYVWRPNGEIVFGVRDPQTGSDIWTLDARGTATVLMNSRAQERSPRVSPDGEWLVYESDVSGQPEVYLRRFTNPGETVVVSDGGGTEPRWAGDRELIYRRGDEVLAVSLTASGASLLPAMARRLFEVADYPQKYDVSADGTRFVLLLRETGARAEGGRVHLVLNWTEELTRLVPVN